MKNNNIKHKNKFKKKKNLVDNTSGFINNDINKTRKINGVSKTIKLLIVRNRNHKRNKHEKSAETKNDTA